MSMPPQCGPIRCACSGDEWNVLKKSALSPHQTSMKITSLQPYVPRHILSGSTPQCHKRVVRRFALALHETTHLGIPLPAAQHHTNLGRAASLQDPQVPTWCQTQASIKKSSIASLSHRRLNGHRRQIPPPPTSLQPHHLQANQSHPGTRFHDSYQSVRLLTWLPTRC